MDNNKMAYEPMTTTVVEVSLEGMLCQYVFSGLFSFGAGNTTDVTGMF